MALEYLQLLSLINDARKNQRQFWFFKKSLPPLTLSKPLISAAQFTADDNAKRGVIDHVTGDGRDTETRIIHFGYNYSETGENIAEAPTAELAFRLWMNDAPHRANIMNPSFRDIGIGIATDSDGMTFWVADFGKL